MGQGGHQKQNSPKLKWEERIFPSEHPFSVSASGSRSYSQISPTVEYLPREKKLILIGGSFDEKKTHLYDFKTNRWTSFDCIFGLSQHRTCVVTLPSKTLVFVFGGYKDSYVTTDTLFVCDISNIDGSKKWREVKAKGDDAVLGSGTKPRGRTYFTLVTSPDQRFIYVFAGTDKRYEYLNDLWRLDVNDERWEKIESSNGVEPSARDNHSAVTLCKENKMIVGFGKRQHGKKYTNEIWSFDFTTRGWKEEKFEFQDKIIPRDSNEMVVIKNRNEKEIGILVGPGFYPDGLLLEDLDEVELTSFWYLDLALRRWTMISTDNGMLHHSYQIVQYEKFVLFLGGRTAKKPSECAPDPKKFSVMNTSDKWRNYEKFGWLTSLEMNWWEGGDPDIEERARYLFDYYEPIDALHFRTFDFTVSKVLLCF